MTDTAIPIPENLQAVMMPALTLRDVLVHGYTPHKEA